MFSTKSFLVILTTFFLLPTFIIAQSFTYSGPTSITIGYNQNSVPATYSFSYYNINNLCYPSLVIALDGNVIANDLCDNPATPSSFTIYFTPGTHVVSFSLLSINCNTLNCYNMVLHQEVEFTVNANFKVRNENTFGGGTIYVDNYTSSKVSPYDRTAYASFSYPIGAIDQDFGGYHWIWNNSGINNSSWQREPKNSPATYYSSNRNLTYTVQSNDKDAKLIAGLRKICKPNFQNSFVSVGNGGIIKVNNTQYNSPTAQFNVVELNPISATAVYQVINGIGYSFQQWNDGSTTVTKTFNPNSTQTYTAYYTGKPLTTNRALHTGTVYNQPVVLYWNEHPNTNVTQYQIWRRVKHNGVMSDPQIIATVNRGTTSYVDDEYNLTRNYSNDLLYYDVRPYYSTENTYSDPNWLAVFGVLMPKTSDSTMVTAIEFENSLSNFPNPFNPTTNIKYSIKESGRVSIKVFDLIGQQITELVNEEKAAGSYSVSFDASQLPSGVYIYTINSANFFQTRKMLLMK